MITAPGRRHAASPTEKTMARADRTYLEWFKEATQEFRVNFHLTPELVAAGAALEAGSTPTVKLEELADGLPERWVDRSSLVTIGTPEVVDALDEDGDVLLEDGAVLFTLAGASREEAPLPGDEYSVLVIANRGDTPANQVAARIWLRIMP